jgi:hypothetical protein
MCLDLMLQLEQVIWRLQNLGVEPTITGSCFAALFATTLIKALQSRQTVVSSGICFFSQSATSMHKPVVSGQECITIESVYEGRIGLLV